MLEPDPLARLLVLPAVAALGFVPVEGAPVPARNGGMCGGAGRAAAAAATTVFVPLERLPDCRSARREAARQAPAWSPAAAPPAAHAGGALPGFAASAAPPPLLVGYASGPEALLAAHRAHHCCDLVLRLTVAVSGEPALVHLPARDPVAAAGLSSREADVLVLLLRGFTTPAVAARLSVAPSTARSHCRAVLRKLGARDRRGLRALLLDPLAPADPARRVDPPSPPRRGLIASGPRFAEGGVSALPRNGP